MGQLKMSAIAVDSAVCKSTDHIVAEVDHEVILMHTVSGRFFSLTDTGRRVWELLDGPTKVSDIVGKIQSEFDVGLSECESDILDLLNDLQQRTLIIEMPLC